MSDSEFDTIMQTISTESYKAYRKLVYETEGFIEYFKSATPIDFIAQLNIGSRPSKRKETQNVEDLRAIPWVLLGHRIAQLSPRGMVWEADWKKRLKSVDKRKSLGAVIGKICFLKLQLTIFLKLF